MTVPYRSFKHYLRETLGCEARRVPLALATTCPNRDAAGNGCVYCDAVGSGAPGLPAHLPVAEQLAQGIARLKPDVRALAYFQPFTTTHGDPATVIAALRAAVAHPRVAGLFVATRPDALPDAVLQELAALARERLVWLELGLQSASDATLTRIRRGHTVADFDRAVARARAANIPVAAHVIAGLPGEGADEAVATARHCAALGVAGIKIHSLYVLRDTLLAQWWRAGEYQPLTLAGYAATVRAMLDVLPPDMVVMRLTGDGPPDRVLAPDWCCDKNRVYAALRAAGVVPAA
ncbi:MAG TPA: TIGR01212 family radical SAM protein [bacterium]|nr:TIGR01212 family radical SAM protein [bacterium]